MKTELAGFGLATSLLALSGGMARAEDGQPPIAGTRVRVTTGAFREQLVIGDLVAVEAARVTVRRAGSSELVAIPLDEKTRIQVSTRSSRKGGAAGIGAMVGFGVGAVVGYAGGDDCGEPGAPTIVCISRPTAATGVGLFGAGVGAVIGLLVGPGEKWETADPASLRVAVTPSARRRGLGLSVSLSF
jgi:hypothetical protein